MKKIIWRTPNKMLFESAHKTFNRQCDCISTGNRIGGAQLSTYVRPKTETVNPVGEKVEYGYLQNWDLDNFIGRDFPGFVKEWIRENVDDFYVIIYEFRHWKGLKKIVHGYVVTTGQNGGYKLLRAWYVRSGLKSLSVVDEAIKYITNGRSKP